MEKEKPPYTFQIPFDKEMLQLTVELKEEQVLIQIRSQFQYYIDIYEFLGTLDELIEDKLLGKWHMVCLNTKELFAIIVKALETKGKGKTFKLEKNHEGNFILTLEFKTFLGKKYHVFLEIKKTHIKVEEWSDKTIG